MLLPLYYASWVAENSNFFNLNLQQVELLNYLFTLWIFSLLWVSFQLTVWPKVACLLYDEDFVKQFAYAVCTQYFYQLRHLLLSDQSVCSASYLWKLITCLQHSSSNSVFYLHVVLRRRKNASGSIFPWTPFLVQLASSTSTTCAMRRTYVACVTRFLARYV